MEAKELLLEDAIAVAIDTQKANSRLKKIVIIEAVVIIALIIALIF